MPCRSMQKSSRAATDISSALKAANAYKRKGTPVTEIFQYMFLLIFSNRSMYMSLLTGKNTPNFAKATLT